MRAHPEPDETWLTAVVDAHYDAVSRYAARRLPADAVVSPDDVAAEVFAAAWRKRAQVPVPELPWLYAAASRVIAQATRAWGRRRRLREKLAAHPVDNAPGADAQVGATTDRAVVTTALGRLSCADAEVVRLWAWEELDHHGIAAVLGCTPAAARKRLQRARQRLADHVRDLGIAGATTTTCQEARASA